MENEEPRLPPVILLLQPRPGAAKDLVAQRDADGRTRVGWNRWPAPVPAGALLLHWPGRFRWSAASSRLAEEVLRADGAVFPLATVLGRLGIPAGRGLEGILAALVPDLAEVEDPLAVGRGILSGLAERLAATELGGSSGETTVREGPSPAIRASLEALPDAPGTYEFLSADGRPLYLGKARSLKERVPRHFARHPAEPEKSRELSRRAAELRWEAAGSELEALLREQLGLLRERPPLNTQERVHRRRRGPWRKRTVLLVLPSVARGCVEVCLVSGDGRWHWNGGRAAPGYPAVSGRVSEVSWREPGPAGDRGSRDGNFPRRKRPSSRRWP